MTLASQTRGLLLFWVKSLVHHSNRDTCVWLDGRRIRSLQTSSVVTWAEREALLWAAIWRIRCDRNLPTIFRSDSALNVGQATGALGAQDDSSACRLLRAAFHLLRSLLPASDLRLEHIHSHCGEPWNELADTLATAETATSFHLSRLQVDFARYRAALPYLWMIFAADQGLPRFCGTGFGAHPIDLPATQYRPVIDSLEWTQTTITCSLASANVNSLSIA